MGQGKLDKALLTAIHEVRTNIELEIHAKMKALLSANDIRRDRVMKAAILDQMNELIRNVDAHVKSLEQYGGQHEPGEVEQSTTGLRPEYPRPASRQAAGAGAVRINR